MATIKKIRKVHPLFQKWDKDLKRLKLTPQILIATAIEEPDWDIFVFSSPKIPGFQVMCLLDDSLDCIIDIFGLSEFKRKSLTDKQIEEEVKAIKEIEAKKPGTFKDPKEFMTNAR